MITITLKNGSDNVVKVTDGDKELVEGTDYEVVGAPAEEAEDEQSSEEEKAE